MPNSVASKCCKYCGVEKPATSAYFRQYGTTNPRLRLKCRLCEGYKQEGDYDRNGGGGCRPGGTRRKLTDEERRENNRRCCARRHAKNKDEINARLRQDRKDNPEKHREWNRRNWEKNREQKRQYKKKVWAQCDKRAATERVQEWRKKNPEKEYAIWCRKYAKHKDKILAYGKKWAKENPEARAAIMNRRRAREFGAEGDYNKDDVRELLRIYGRVCFYCSTFLTKFHVDHFIPLARGGSNDPDNLRLSCPSCNYSKAARMPWDWMPEKFSAQICEAA